MGIGQRTGRASSVRCNAVPGLDPSRFNVQQILEGLARERFGAGLVPIHEDFDQNWDFLTEGSPSPNGWGYNTSGSPTVHVARFNGGKFEGEITGPGSGSYNGISIYKDYPLHHPCLISTRTMMVSKITNAFISGAGEAGFRILLNNYPDVWGIKYRRNDSTKEAGFWYDLNGVFDQYTKSTHNNWPDKTFTLWGDMEPRGMLLCDNAVAAADVTERHEYAGSPTRIWSHYTVPGNGSIVIDMNCDSSSSRRWSLDIETLYMTLFGLRETA